jgi:alkylated DNA repair protein alkB homolog 8
MINIFATASRSVQPVSRIIYSFSTSTSDINHIMPSPQESICSSSVKSTPEIEKNFVHRVYDAIAPHFSSTRFAKWPKVAAFLNSLKTGSVVLDAGCGNGKYLGFNPDCFFIGCDISPSLIEICEKRGHEVLIADAINLPYRENFGDAAISIAVLHHLSTEKRRRKAIEELVRVVKKGGLVLITVWAVEQEDQSLLAKWKPLFTKYDDEWVEPSMSPTHNQSIKNLERIPETETMVQELDDENKLLNDEASPGTGDNSNKAQQEYFVPWHLPYHRAEVSGASAVAVENGFAKKDDKKGAVVYNRYYHVFAEGELQRYSPDLYLLNC